MKLNSLLMLTLFLAQTGWTADSKDLSQQIAELMFQAAGNHPGYRPVHAKGIVCKGTFAPSPDAQTVSRAAHFQGGTIPVTSRFSDGASDPTIPDSSPDAAPRGMAIPFAPRVDTRPISLRCRTTVSWFQMGRLPGASEGNCGNGSLEASPLAHRSIPRQPSCGFEICLCSRSRCR